MEPARPSAAPRICLAALEAVDAERLRHAAALGFDTVLLSSNTPAIGGRLIGDGSAAFDDSHLPIALIPLVRSARLAGVRLMLDLALERFPAGHPLVTSHPQAFTVRCANAPATDPRAPAPLDDEVRARLGEVESAETVRAFAVGALKGLARIAIHGVRVLRPQAAAPEFWRRLIEDVREEAPGFVFIAEGEGAPRAGMLALAGCGFDAVTSSLPFWDGRARWLVEEQQALSVVAPVLASVDAPPSHRTALPLTVEQRFLLAVVTGTGLIARLPEVDGTGLDTALREANAMGAELRHFAGELRMLSGEGAEATALLRANAPDVRRATAALLVLLNPEQTASAPTCPQDLLAACGAEFEPFARVDGVDEPFAPLRPGEVRLLLARRSQPIGCPPSLGSAAAEDAAVAHRLVVEDVTPRVDGGRHPVRRVVGERVTVEADVFGDGHEQLAVELQWRALDEASWRAMSMVELGNDRWRADFPLERLGRYEFVIEGWLDVYGGFKRDYRKKRDAGVVQPVDTLEGVEFIRHAAKRTSGEPKASLKEIVARLKAAPDDDARGDILLDDTTALLMARADERPHRLRSEGQFVDAERLQARFASWYELFPRSQSGDASRHGTFEDVIARLPQVRAMGFDVLYFPPIHPIGRKNMKGKNNSLSPGEDDVGSPYAIGSEAGGHDAIHAQLGSFKDFRRLVAAAAEHGLEIALDFAIQCSPDHPWLKQHPGWFDWRPDGSIKYAENPPKKYQDIVNVDFYKSESIPDLWLALRDVVLLWVGEGVKLFRVDNPHTKPFAFWEWMIGEVRAAYPDVVFLAEAFTRPKVMYRLAKIGFSQLYTYFTWRHTKAEFVDYLTELTTTAPKEFFRPHFFVNTPDINPPFLQSSGRAGFLIRAALASTLSGLWGVYSGFELCEFEALPGREEYKDSEKYELRPRPVRAPGDIVDEIARLNLIRKGHPALQTHLGVEFLPSWNEQVLVYAKTTPWLHDVVVVAVSLDPHHPQETGFELPLCCWGLGDHAEIQVEDLVWESRFIWHGKSQQVRLDPSHPYAVWSVQAPPRRIEVVA